MDDPAVLFVKPQAVKASDKAALRKAGIIVVEIEDPSSVRLIRAGYELPTSAILGAAAKAIATTGAYESSREAFGKAMCAAIEAAVLTKE